MWACLVKQNTNTLAGIEQSSSSCSHHLRSRLGLFNCTWCHVNLYNDTDLKGVCLRPADATVTFQHDPLYLRQYLRTTIWYSLMTDY